LNTILTTLTTHGITTITAQPPTLEQLFMRHYTARPADADRRAAEAAR
ncbi:hypothetical protein CLV72_107377, partial [Allonocardiopsis opalescens]